MASMVAGDPVPEGVLHEQIPGEALRLVTEAAGHSLVLRVTGSLGVRLHCPRLAPLLDAMGRRRFRDIDFFGYMREQRELERLLRSRGYVADRQMAQSQEWGVKRLLYEHPDTHVKIDVFMDELKMAHSFEFRGRLELDSPTIPLADLLLSKLQIHEITENDLMDMAVLLAEHEIGPGDPEQIDIDRIVGILRADWGFCHTALDNIAKCEVALGRYAAIAPGVAVVIRERLSEVRDRVDAAPKTMKWKLRARVGTRARWYEEVHELDRA
jgi:hypothetical protein